MQNTKPRRQEGHPASSPLEKYLREVEETALLSAEEEKDLARKIEDGDSEARDQLLRANLHLVVDIARKYTGKGLGMRGLIEEGNLGLLRAVEGFDPRVDVRFSTYAAYWIRQSIKRALVNTAKTSRIPTYILELLAEWDRAASTLQGEFGRSPTQGEVAQRLNWPKNKLAIVKKAIRLHYAAPQFVFLSHSRMDRAMAAVVKKELTARGLVLQHAPTGLLNYEIAKGIRTAIIESGAVVVLATPGNLDSEKGKLEIAIANAWRKPVFVVTKDLSQKNLPASLRRFPAFRLDQVDKLGESVYHACQPEFSNQEMSWLVDWYKKQAVPLDQLVEESSLLAELAIQFRRTWGRGIAPERLLGGLFQARKLLGILLAAHGGSANSKSRDLGTVEADDLKYVLELLDEMDPREAIVLRMCFGLGNDEPKTLREIGESLGLTRERVRHIQSDALSKLSESMNGN